MYVLHVGDLKELRPWLDTFDGPYKVNVLLILLLFLVFYPLFNSVFYSIMTVVVFCTLFSIADMQKMRILNQPLLPGDFLFIRQALLIAKLYLGPVMAALLCLAAICTGLFLVRKKVPHFKLSPVARGALSACIGLIIAYTATHYQATVSATNKHFKIVNEYWNQLTNFKKNGILYTFLMNLRSLGISRPQNYSQATIQAIFSTKPDTTPVPDTQRMHPDIIVYMSESFWDITQIVPTPLPCDPIPVFRSLTKKSPSLRLVSPVFGGNTCNAEFEVLTGLSHGFFPPGVMAYNQLIQHPIPSLVKVMRENGYHTTGIHTFKQWFWNRVNVYRQLGFESFISVETMNNPRIKGFYVADMELVEATIAQARQKDHPDFIFALSMQNHGPFNVKRYDTLACSVSTGLSKAADCELNSYVQGLIDADASLGVIKHYIDTTGQPTMLVFYGDHLPALTQFYNEIKITDRLKADTIWAHTTMSVWYANFPLEPLTDSIVSMMYLPSLIAQQASLRIPHYYHYLDILRAEYPIFPTGHLRTDSTGHMIDTLLERRKNECRLCIYDALLGKQYGAPYEYLFKK